MLWELINPSDPYTFEAPNLSIAAVCAELLSRGFGARCIDPGHDDECSPVLFGWDEWLKDRGIDGDWVVEHRHEIADALDSFLIGRASERKEAKEAMAMMTPEKAAEYKAARQERNRTSMNQIGEAAYKIAARLRKMKVHQKT